MKHNIPWPTLPSGELALDDDTFREMARSYDSVRLMRELRCSLSQMRLEDLAVGLDARNRVLLSAFRARTSRNQPSNTKFIFGPATWLRGLIQPPQGYGLAYIDWSQQEFGIAAALSGDGNMIAAYESGDPYLAFAKQAGAAPPHATKKSHAAIREQFKACILGVQYAMGADSLAVRINQCPAAARELLRMHRSTYPIFWRWSDAAVDHAMLHGSLQTTFGWSIHAGPTTNARSLRNFPMQANGAEMLRFACCFATEGGIRVCAPVHDAILIEAPLEDLEDAVVTAQAAMSDHIERSKTVPQRAREHIARGHAKVALRILEEHLIDEPEDAEAWYVTAEVLSKLGRMEDAFRAMTQARELSKPAGRRGP
jgi:tetratricopeptide (TPR) repeat protein